jgi:hypothetical protein
MYERWWHATGSGPRTQSSRAWFLPYSGAKSDVPELAQRADGLDHYVTTNLSLLVGIMYLV